MIFDNLLVIKNYLAKQDTPVKLVVVTKNQPIDKINQAIRAGAKIIGENRIQEAEEKFPHLLPVEKHMIGHLQSNKVKKAVQLFDCIQSVDSIKLANKVNNEAQKQNKTMKIMLEIKFEEQKNGFLPEELPSGYETIKKLPNIEIIGLMCMAPLIEPEQTIQFFKKAKQLQTQLNLKYLSAGMSNDYKIAIEQGSNIVRIGTSIFR